MLPDHREAEPPGRFPKRGLGVGRGGLGHTSGRGSGQQPRALHARQDLAREPGRAGPARVEVVVEPPGVRHAQRAGDVDERRAVGLRHAPEVGELGGRRPDGQAVAVERGPQQRLRGPALGPTSARLGAGGVGVEAGRAPARVEAREVGDGGDDDGLHAERVGEIEQRVEVAGSLALHRVAVGRRAVRGGPGSPGCALHRRPRGRELAVDRRPPQGRREAPGEGEELVVAVVDDHALRAPVGGAPQQAQRVLGAAAVYPEVHELDPPGPGGVERGLHHTDDAVVRVRGVLGAAGALSHAKLPRSAGWAHRSDAGGPPCGGRGRVPEGRSSGGGRGADLRAAPPDPGTRGNPSNLIRLVPA